MYEGNSHLTIVATWVPFWPTWIITRCSTVLLEKLTGSQPVNTLPAFYDTQKFTTTFTSARHLSQSWASSIQSIPPYHTSWRSILILFSHLRLGLPSCLFLSGFPTKTLYTPLLSPINATGPPFYSSRFYHQNNIGWAVQIINPYRTNVENRVSS